MKTGVEIPLPITHFDHLPDTLLEKVPEEFTRLGGKADPAFVLHGTRRMDKPALKG